LDEKEETTDGEDDDIIYLTDLAETLGADPAQLYGIKVKVADGQEFTIGELKDKIQAGSQSMEATLREIEQTKEKAYQRIMQEREEILSSAKKSASLPDELQNLNTELMSLEARYNSVDWDKFAENDPGKAALLSNQFNQAREELKGKISKAEKDYEEAQFTRRNQYMQAAAAEFARRVPEWKDEKVANEEGGKMTSLVKSYGISDQEIGHITDPRMKHLIRDFAVLRSEYESAKTNKQKVLSEGVKALRRSAVSGRFLGKQDKSTQAVEMAKKTGKEADKYRAIAALLQEAGEI